MLPSFRRLPPLTGPYEAAGIRDRFGLEWAWRLPIRLLPVLLLAACGPSAEGFWLGQCVTPQTEVRTRLSIRPRTDEDPDLVALATLHEADRPGDALFLDCIEFEALGPDIFIDDCSGIRLTSEVESFDHDFSVTAQIDADGLTDTMSGGCFYDGENGDLQAVRTPP